MSGLTGYGTARCYSAGVLSHLRWRTALQPRTPKSGLQWFGPDMSVRSSITARLMETWAHSQAIYDLLGRTRTNTDRIKNVVVMGMNTFAGLREPASLPCRTDSPTCGSAPRRERCGSGISRIRRTGSRQRGRVLSGSDAGAEYRGLPHFKCVAIRLIDGCRLSQCFAGPPEEPPAPGSRFRQV